MNRRLLVLLAVLLALGACAAIRPVEQRTTVGPGAEEFWLASVVAQNGRPPTFDERRHWEDTIDARIAQYLRAHPEVANSLEVSNFRFHRRVMVGMDQDQVRILLGPPLSTTTDAGAMEKLARRYWPAIKGNATEAWAYPGGWVFYFAGSRLVDITQYVPTT